MGARWLNDDQLVAWVRLAAVLELLPGALDSQLRRDAGLTHFEYFTLAMLSEAPARTLRMTALAALTNATLARLSHVVRRLEQRGLVERHANADDARVTETSLTPAGLRKVEESAPGHVAAVRHNVVDALTREQVGQLADIAGAILERLDPEATMAKAYDLYHARECR